MTHLINNNLIPQKMVLEKFENTNNYQLSAAQPGIFRGKRSFWNGCISINVSFTIYKGVAPQDKILVLVLQDTLKIAF